MNPRAAFGLSTLMNLLSSIVLAALFARPFLRNINTEQALIWLVAPHMVRFIGLSFLVPGVVSGSLPKAWAIPAAYGDFVAAMSPQDCVGLIKLCGGVWQMRRSNFG
jgi:hypothetical protein